MPTIFWLLLFAGVAGIALFVAFRTRPQLFKSLAQGVRQLQNLQQSPLEDHSLEAKLSRVGPGSAISIRQEGELESRDLLVQSTTSLQIQKNPQTRVTWIAILLEKSELLIKIEDAWFLLKQVRMTEAEADEISSGQRHLLSFRFANKRCTPRESDKIIGLTIETGPFSRKVSSTMISDRPDESILLTLNFDEMVVLSAFVGKEIEIIEAYNKV